MSYASQEILGIVDLLKANEENLPILFQLAKSVTKNIIDITTEQDALNTLFQHIPDCSTLLNKRVITKEILFKYLHKNKVPLIADLTKAQLIKKVIDYWYQQYANSKSPSNEYNAAANGRLSEATSEFPIHLLARKFSEWFFDNYNNNSLKLNDFWSDASLMLQILANDGRNEHICKDSDSILQTLVETRQQFGFYFNPNLTHAGVQGRMDMHGLVLVLACGTLHTEQECVGVFECVFGLLRDPYAENNWKCKNIKFNLRSKTAPSMPSLEESDDLREALELPVPNGELT